MKFKVVLCSNLVFVTLFVAVVNLYAFGASTFTVSAMRLFPSFTSAFAAIGGFGLENGTWDVYAKVDDIDQDAGSFKNGFFFRSASDFGGVQIQRLKLSQKHRSVVMIVRVNINAITIATKSELKSFAGASGGQKLL